MFDQSYLRRAGQFWKLSTGLAALVLGGGLMAAGFALINKSSDLGSKLLIAGTAVGLAGATWAIAAVRCPKCGARLFWRAIARQKPEAWLFWLMSLNSCPSCGAVGDKAARRGDAAPTHLE